MFHLLCNARVFAPRPLGLQHLLVCAGRIVYLGHEVPTLDAALGVEAVDLEGRWVLPGLIDAHAHLTGGGGEAGFRTRVPHLPLTAFTRAGVTTAIGLLGTDDETRSIADLVATVRALREEGFSAYAYTGGYHLPPTTLTGSVRKDLVSIDCIVGFGELALSDHRSSQPTFDEVLRVASDCHVAGLITGKAGVLHCHLGDGARGLDLIRRAVRETEVPPRTFHPTHVNRRRALFEEACALTREGVPIDVTAFPPPEPPAGPGPDDELAAAEAIVAYLEAGLPPEKLTVSSDGGGCLPFFNRQGELERMDFATPQTLFETLQTLLADGHAPEAVVPFFTSNVAQQYRLHRKGRLAVGMDADVVVLDERFGVRDVMARGAWHLRDGQPVRKGLFEG